MEIKKRAEGSGVNIKEISQHKLYVKISEICNYY